MSAPLMPALVLRAPGRLDLAEVPVPVPAADELLVRTRAALICTSDLIDIRDNPFGIPLPVVMGHEASGVVEAAGAATTGFAPGDPVATHPVHPCRRCAACREGLPHLCEDMGHFALNRPGTFAGFYTVRADRARRVPAGLDAAVAALAEPVSVCLEALDQARTGPGRRLLIVGDGPFGVLLARLALARGAEVVIAGHQDRQLAMAAGARAVNVRGLADAAGALRAAAPGGYHAAVVAVSSAAAYQQALPLLRPRGRLVAFAPVFGGIPLDLALVHMKELEVVGAVNDLDLFDEAVRILAAPGCGLGDLVTHRLPFAGHERAFRLAAERTGGAMKVALLFG